MHDNVIQPYTDDQLRCFVATKYSLSTHQLSKEDIIFAADYVTQLYGRKVKGSPMLTNEKLILFLTLSYRKGLCKYALTYNRELDSAIDKRDLNLFNYLLNQDVSAFVEIYDNTLLSVSDREFLTRLLTHELVATADMLKANEGLTHEDRAKCLDRSCHAHAEIVESDPVARVIRENEAIPEVFCVYDKVHKSRCYPLLETIELLVTEKLDKASPFLKKDIMQRFQREIDMYRRYLLSYQ